MLINLMNQMFHALLKAIRISLSFLQPCPYLVSIHKKGVNSIQRPPINVKHQPRPIACSTGSIKPVPAAPIRQRVRLFAAVIDDGDAGYRSTMRVFVAYFYLTTVHDLLIRLRKGITITH